MNRTARPPLQYLSAAATAALLLGLAGCAKPRMVQGECHAVNGTATVPLPMVENAPDEAPMEWPPVPAAVLRLPEVVSANTGFDELTVFWEPHGHPPGPYLTPHFDFHFYSISGANVQAIDCADSTKPAQLAAGYELPDVTIEPIGDLVGLCVPGMGMHALPAAELASTAPFEKTMVLGYYAGQPIFVEPMITSAALLERHSFTLDIPEIPGGAANVRYPKKFSADYDAVAHTYTFRFSDFTPAGTT